MTTITEDRQAEIAASLTTVQEFATCIADYQETLTKAAENDLAEVLSNTWDDCDKVRQFLSTLGMTGWDKGQLEEAEQLQKALYNLERTVTHLSSRRARTPYNFTNSLPQPFRCCFGKCISEDNFKGKEMNDSWLLLAFDSQRNVEPGHISCLISTFRSIWDVVEKEDFTKLSDRERHLLDKTIMFEFVGHDGQRSFLSSLLLHPLQLKCTDLSGSASQKVKQLAQIATPHAICSEDITTHGYLQWYFADYELGKVLPAEERPQAVPPWVKVIPDEDRLG